MEKQKARFIDKLIESENKAVALACEEHIAETDRKLALKKAEIANFSGKYGDYNQSFRTVLQFGSSPL